MTFLYIGHLYFGLEKCIEMNQNESIPYTKSEIHDIGNLIINILDI